MDTQRWKSVLVPIEVYRELKELSHIEGRTISGQLRVMFEMYANLRSTKTKVAKARKNA
jgi:hypothetical protein